MEGHGGHRHRRHHDGAGQERRARGRVRHAADGARPLLRVTAHVRTATFRWIGAAIGGYHDGENALADQLEDSFGPGILNLADRGFFSMHRWIRFSGTGADLAWRVKNGAKSLPLKTLETLPDGSELVMLHESDGMRARRRRETGDRHAERLPDTIARLVTFTVTTVTRSGRAKTTRIRVLTTLLDHRAHPAAEIAVLYAERWQIEIAFLHLKRTVRGPRRPLRGQSPELARQEAWALLLIHNITATATARAAGPAASTPASSPSPPSSASSAPTSLPTPAAGTAATAAPARMPRWPAWTPRSSPCPATARAASEPPAGPQPNDEPGTPRKSLTPSTSQSRISRNGTQLRKLKGSAVCRLALIQVSTHILDMAQDWNYDWRAMNGPDHYRSTCAGGVGLLAQWAH